MNKEISEIQSMYENYFLDYASYVVLERAVPYLSDGLKPVQRRILHSMWEIDDGRYHKVANIVGHSMRFHPHGDMAIGGALVQLGQKNLLIDTQGNWGNILTGDSAAASRYIEARLTPFAKEITFQPEITKFIESYDGRNKEPITLPMKFPLLLAHGAEGIAVGLACKVLSHNFQELIDASICVLRNQKFEIYPDFMTGGLISINNYEDGLRGGKVEVRAKILIEKKTLRITEIPFGVITTSLIESILSSNDKGRIKITRVEDNTAKEVDISIHLPSGTDLEKARDALYAFTDCQVSVSPNACVIEDGKPLFIGVSEILKRNVFQIKEILKQELELSLRKLEEKWHFCSLEKYFIERKIYRLIEECESWEEIVKAIYKGMKPIEKKLKRSITDEDIIRLTEIKIKRISKYSSFQSEEILIELKKQISEIGRNLKNLTRYAIAFLKNLKKKYGKGRERRTKIAQFGKVERTEVIATSETFYIDRKNGFVGLNLKKEEALFKCSKLANFISIDREGILKVEKVSAKAFVGANPFHIALFNKEENPVYSILYREGKSGPIRAKRFKSGGVIRGREYSLLKGGLGKILHFSCHPNEKLSNEGCLLIELKKNPRLKTQKISLKFREIPIRNRSSQGLILTKHPINRVKRL